MTDLTALAGTWTVDPAHSRIGFVARHAMVTKVRGSFDDFTATASLDGTNPAASHVEVAIQTKSFDTRNAQRDEHVRSADFLDVEKYPQITFRSTNVEVTGDDTFDLTGDLTIKDVTKSVTIPFEFQGTATDPFGNARAGFEGSVTVNRKDYGLTWNAALETGGVLVSEKVVLEFEISAIQNA